jgi:hypothetical protein
LNVVRAALRGDYDLLQLGAGRRSGGLVRRGVLGSRGGRKQHPNSCSARHYRYCL